MAVKISDLVPKKISISVGESSLEVACLGLAQMTTLIENYKEPLLQLIASSGSGNVDFAALLTTAPDMVVSLIALGADAVGQEDDIRLLPVGVQIEAAAAIWQLSVPDVKKLVSVLSTVLAQMQPAQVKSGE